MPTHLSIFHWFHIFPSRQPLQVNLSEREIYWVAASACCTTVTSGAIAVQFSTLKFKIWRNEFRPLALHDTSHFIVWRRQKHGMWNSILIFGARQREARRDCEITHNSNAIKRHTNDRCHVCVAHFDVTRTHFIFFKCFECASVSAPFWFASAVAIPHLIGIEWVTQKFTFDTQHAGFCQCCRHRRRLYNHKRYMFSGWQKTATKQFEKYAQTAADRRDDEMKRIHACKIFNTHVAQVSFVAFEWLKLNENFKKAKNG